MKRQFIIDEEISLTGANDILKTKVYSDNLKEVILNTPDKKVFTIGLFGSWGAGKSSIIRTAKEDIENNNPKIKFITYDAWKYVNDSFRRMFLLKVQQELRYEQTEEMQRFYQSETAEAEPKTYISSHGLVGLLFVLLIVNIILWFLPINTECKISTSSISTLVGLMLSIYNGVFQKLKIQINKPMIFAPEQFENCFREMVTGALQKENLRTTILKFIKVANNSLSGLEKIVIVIDNIDRCHNTMAYQLLTDIKTFLSNEALNVVFIIPVDDEALKQNLFTSSENKKDCNKEKEEFLRKFFNVTIRIKPHQVSELLSFAQGLNIKYDLGYNDDTIALCSKEFATNPRRIIQLFNNLASELCLYPDEFAQEHETIICVIQILREEYILFYTDVVKDVYKLYNFEKANAEKYQAYESLDAFMRIAAPIIRNTNVNDILRIVNNSEAIFSDIPQIIQESITTYHAEPVVEYITQIEDNQNLKKLLQFIIKNIRENIKSKSESQIINSLEYVSAISVKTDLPDYFFRMLDAEYLDLYKKLLNSIDKSSSKNLCQLANKLAFLNLRTLKGSILGYIKDIKLDEPNNINVEQPFIEAVFTIFNSQTDCKYLQNFATNLFKVTNLYTNIEYTPEQINYLFTDELIKFYIDKITIGDNTESDELLWLLRNRDSIQTDCYSLLFEKILNLIGSTTNKPKEQILSYIEYISKFLVLVKENCLDGDTKFLSLNEKLEKRSVSNVTRYILEEYKDNINERNTITDYIIQVYRVSNTITNSQVQKSISHNKEYTYSKLIELVGSGYNLRPFVLVVMDDMDYSSNSSIELHKYYLLQNDSDIVSAITDSILQNKVKSLLDNISNPGVHKLIDEICVNDRVKQAITQDIIGRDATYVNQLPQSLLNLAISRFTIETSATYIDNMEFLSVIATKGSQEQKIELVKILTNKINQNKDIDKVLNILETIGLSKDYNKSMLYGALQSYKESSGNNNEQLNKIISKFSK